MACCNCSGGMCACSANSKTVGSYDPSSNDVYSPAFKSSIADIANAPFNFSGIGSPVDGVSGGESVPMDAEAMEMEPADIVDGDGYGIQPNEPWRTKYFKWHDLIHWWFAFGGNKNGSAPEKSVNLHTAMSKIQPGAYQQALINLDKIYENYQKSTGDTFFINAWAVVKGGNVTNSGGDNLRNCGLRVRSKTQLPGFVKAIKSDGAFTGWYVYDSPSNGSPSSNHFTGIAFDLHSRCINKSSTWSLWNWCAANFAKLGPIKNIEGYNHTAEKTGVKSQSNPPGWCHIDWGSQSTASAIKKERSDGVFLYCLNADSAKPNSVFWKTKAGARQNGNVYWSDGTKWST